jgi:hypothetical protein
MNFIDNLLSAIVAFVAATAILWTLRENRRFLDKLDKLENQSRVQYSIESCQKVKQQPVASPDLVRLHRVALIDGLMRGSGQMLEAGDPRWRRINDIGMAALDNCIYEYPYCGRNPAMIDNLTIHAALNSQRRTITEG